MQDQPERPRKREFLERIIWEEDENCIVMPNSVMHSFHMPHDLSLADLFKDKNKELMDTYIGAAKGILQQHDFAEQYLLVSKPFSGSGKDDLLDMCKTTLKKYLQSVGRIAESPVYLGVEGNFCVGIRSPKPNSEEEYCFTFTGENDEIMWQPLGKTEEQKEHKFVRLIRNEEFTICLKEAHTKKWRGVQFKSQQSLGNFLYIAGWENDRIQSFFKLNYHPDNNVNVHVNYRQLTERQQERREMRYIEGGVLRRGILRPEEIRRSGQ